MAEGVVRSGPAYLGEPLRLLHAEDARLEESRKLLDSLTGGVQSRSVISTDPPGNSEAALFLARHVDAVLLLIPLERARVAEIRRLVEQIGRDRIVGAVAV